MLSIERATTRRLAGPDEKKGGPLRMTKPREGAEAPDIVLTEDQQEALDTMLAWDDTKEPFFLLTGYAGTGKTTVLQHYIRASGRSAVLTAPTNKAVRVLERMAADYGLRVPCCTLHRLLGLKIRKDHAEKYCDRDPDQISQGRPLDIPVFRTLIVDECSMVGNKEIRTGARWVPGLLDQLRKRLREWDMNGNPVKVIFVGDPGQLPPVKEGELSPTFETEPRVFLERVVRQALDNPIIRLATYIRAKVDGREEPEPLLEDNGFAGVYRTTDAREFRDLMIEAYLDVADHPTKYKALAFRNNTVDGYNDEIRRALHGANAPKYIIGERYVATEPVMEWPDGPRGKPIIHATTDEDAVLLDIGEVTLKGMPGNYRPMMLAMESDRGPFPAFVPHPDKEAEWEADKKKLAELAREDRQVWPQFWELHDIFAHFKPHYVMTCHRSQGSTYENVFVDVVDVLTHPSGFWEAGRCLYTACTRASQMLYLYDR